MQSTSKLKYAISTIAEDVWVAKQDDSLLSILFSIDGRVYNMEYMRKIIDPCILWGFERRWSESKGMIISECVGQIVPFGLNDVRNFDVSALSQMVKESVQKVRDTQQEIYEKLGTIPATVDEVKAAIARYGVECIWDQKRIHEIWGGMEPVQEPLNQNEPTARSIADHLYTLMQQYDPQFMQQYPNREVQVSETEHAICSGDLNDFFQIEMMALAVRNDEHMPPALRDQAANLLQEMDKYKEINHTFSIYQLKQVPDNRDYLFQPYDRLKEKGVAVDPDKYDLIYTAPLPDLTTLDDIYRKFNLEHPDDFTGHSLSVSDIVVEKFSDREVAYYCDMYGFTEVPEFLENQKQHMETNRMSDRAAPATEDQKDMLSVLVVKPGKTPYAKSIGSDLKSLQNEVDGYIEAIYPFDDPVALICNEEGKINGLPLNRALRDENDKAYDIISGTFMVVGLGEEDFSSLSDDLMKKYTEYFKAPERFIVGDGKIVVLKPKEPEPPRMSDQLAAARSEVDKQGKGQDDPQNRNEQER